MHRRALLITAAALCAAATITIGTLAPASGDEGKTVQFVVTSPITNLAQFGLAYASETSRCTFNGTFTNVVSPCVAPVTATGDGAYNDTLTGDFQGTGQHAGVGVLTAINDLPTGDIAFESYEPYSLHVEGCGTGTLILHDEGNANSPDGVWRIVPGSGRGDLRGISGGGTYAAGTNPFSTHNYVGHVRCAKHGQDE